MAPGRMPKSNRDPLVQRSILVVRARGCQTSELNASNLRTHLINREWARCPRFGAAARREEGEYPLWIFDRRATPQQGQRSATRRAVFWRASGGVAPQSESAAAIFLRRALPAARQKTARPFPIYEMGSSILIGNSCRI